MSRKFAHLAGLAAVVILAAMVVAEIDADMGGPRIDTTYTELTALVVCVLAATYIARQVIDAELRIRPRRTPMATEAAEPAVQTVEGADIEMQVDMIREHVAEIINSELQALVVAMKEQVMEAFHGDLEAALSEVYRLGVAAGAERVARGTVPRLAVVPPRES